MKFKKNILLLGLFLSISIIGCNTGTIRDYTEEDWEIAGAWELTNVDSEITISNYIVYEGGHSLQIFNGGCGDLTLSHKTFPVIGNKEYELSFAFRRSPTDYDENTMVNPADAENTSILLGENFSVILKQGVTNLVDELVEIEQDFTWETKTITYTPDIDGELTLTFRLGCDLKRLWIDIFELEYELEE